MTARHDSGSRGDIADGVGDVVILCAEEEVRDVIAYWFTTLPTRTFIADDGYHATRLLEEGERRWLVTDRILPPWPGLATFLQLRHRYPNLHIAFIENGNFQDRILARVAGATVLLQRPLTRKAVIEALARCEPTRSSAS